MGRSRLTSLDKTAAIKDESGGEIFTYHDVLSNGQEDPSTKAARRLDWETFLNGLPEGEMAAIAFMVLGKTLRDAAHALRVSDSTMQNTKGASGIKSSSSWAPTSSSRCNV